MIIEIENDVITVTEGESVEKYGIGSPEGFKVISDLWLRSGWDAKYVYGFSWMGRPIIQLPDDLIRIQEVMYSVKPDVIIETGVAHGGGLIFYASLCKAMGRGKVIGVDVEIRPHNRKAIEEHELFEYITLIEGNSIGDDIVKQVESHVKPGETVLVTLDSCHTKAHVAAELEAYSHLVSAGSYIVAMDGIMEDMAGAPRSDPDWTWNNPSEAALEFVKNNPDFQLEEPEFPFNEGEIKQRVTYWPNAFIKRIG